METAALQPSRTIRTATLHRKTRTDYGFQAFDNRCEPLCCQTLFEFYSEVCYFFFWAQALLPAVFALFWLTAELLSANCFFGLAQGIKNPATDKRMTLIEPIERAGDIRG
jgi:hypothetical protein